MTVMPQVGAMNFRSADFTAYRFAEHFAGEDGHVATLPEIVSGRLEAPIEDLIWRHAYTTATAEYVGKTRGGVDIVIVAHGKGPLATAKGAEAAYGTPSEYGAPGDAKSGDIYPRISLKEFRALESGAYGDVTIVELETIRRVYGANGYYRLDDETTERDPLLAARMGASWQQLYDKVTSGIFSFVKSGSHMELSVLSIISNPPYMLHEQHVDGEQPTAHLLGIRGAVANPGRRTDDYFEFDVEPHDPADYLHFIGVRKHGSVIGTHVGPQKLKMRPGATVVPNNQTELSPPPYYLHQFGTQWFTSRFGGSAWPEYPIAGIDLVGAPFTVQSQSSNFPKYDIKIIHGAMPEGANAFYLGDPKRVMRSGEEVLEGTVYSCNVTLKSSLRCPTPQELDSNFDLQMRLLERLDRVEESVTPIEEA